MIGAQFHFHGKFRVTGEMQFHKQLQLAAEAHEEEVTQLCYRHCAELSVAHEEIKRLREEITFLEALLPREYKRRLAMPSDTQSSACSLGALECHTVPADVDESHALLPILLSDVPVDVHEACVDEIHVMLPTNRVPKSDASDCRSVLHSPAPSGFIKAEADATMSQDTRVMALTISAQGSAASSMSVQSSSGCFGDTSREDSIEWEEHNEERACLNWCTIGKLALLTNSIGGSRLHPAWHSSVSRLKHTFDVENSELSVDHNFSLHTDFPTPDIAAGIARASCDNRKEEEVNRFVRLSRLRSLEDQEKRVWCQKPLVLTPNSKLRILWDACSASWCCYDFVMFPLQFVDSMNLGEYEHTRTWVSTMFWTLDILVSLSTGYYTKDGGVELRRLLIFKQYLKSWFLFDVLVLAPDWVTLAVGATSPKIGLGIFKFTRVFRLIRLMRAVRLLPKLWESIGQHNSERVVTVCRLLQHIIMMLLVNHYVACFLLATWLELEIRAEIQPWVTYFSCLHWALAHSTLGNMDIFPSSLFERLWTCLFLIMSMILFSYFLSNITSAVTHLGSLTQERRKQETRMRQFFKENKVARLLAGQIWNYVWRYHDLESHTRLSDVKLFTLLPSRMKVELHYQIFLPYLLVHPMFSWYNKLEPEALVVLCSHGIQQQFLHPSEEMLVQYNIVKQMIFVNSGDLLYLPNGSSVEQALTVRCHRWICEEALWSISAKINGIFSAGLFGADLMLILPEAFRALACKYSRSMPHLVNYAQHFVIRFNAACQDDEFEQQDLLFNDPFLAESLVRAAKVETRQRFSIQTKRTIASQAFNVQKSNVSMITN